MSKDTWSAAIIPPTHEPMSLRMLPIIVYPIWRHQPLAQLEALAHPICKSGPQRSASEEDIQILPGSSGRPPEAFSDWISDRTCVRKLPKACPGARACRRKHFFIDLIRNCIKKLPKSCSGVPAGHRRHFLIGFLIRIVLKSYPDPARGPRPAAGSIF